MIKLQVQMIYVPRFLSKVKGDISYHLTLLFQKIMEDREVPDESK